MSWEDIEDAVQNVVQRASNLNPGQVIWSYQNADEPTAAHIVINFGGEIVVGIDRVKTTQDLSKPLGFEIKQEVKGVREVPLEIQVFTPEVTGSRAARRIAELVRSRFRFADLREQLAAVGLSPFDPGPVSWVPDIPNAQFRGRATMTVRCYVPVMDCVEYTTYIARVVGTVFPTGFVHTSYGTTGIAFDTQSP